ncbi:TolC family protein [Marinihelvus fidelis]|uniref:TolC family protein n=1 Tax=Marinihelvus fidelis TaxID=2613842 RepID=A0A5N0TLE1_9GAMM|nr:TolC family protein [Marinihelvus fidelis]KAA9134139.1 TolC family protein [Marinihelvus fidelis]
MRRLIIAGAAALLSACAVGPDYERPETQAPAEFDLARDHQLDASSEQLFWGGFGDPLLAELVQQTLDANQALAAALARYDRASALLEGAERGQWPNVSAQADGAKLRLADSERIPPGAGPRRVDSYSAGLVADWELDLFGRLRRITESQRAELDATAADVAAVQVALVGQLASSYFELRGLQQLYAVVEANVSLQREAVDIVTARLDAGRGTEFDQVRAQAQLERINAGLPLLRASIRVAMHRIAVLTGQSPDALVDVLAPVKALPGERPVIAAGTPGDLLRRRPDIAAAERRLAAATARIGVATADLYPRFTLSGLLGTVAPEAGDLFSDGTGSRAVALGVDWTFLNYGYVRSRIDAADAESREALANYQQTVLTALEDTESSLVRYQQSRQRTEHLLLAVEAATEAARLARVRYERGFIGYFEVLSADQELVSVRDVAVQSQTAEVLAMVDVYRALAGAPGPLAL